MITVLENAEVYTPEKIGKTCVTYDGEFIAKVGDIDKKALLKTGLDVEIVDLKGALLIPGLVDPHEHLLGGSGESGGFSTQTPEVSLTELTQAGITTVVGTLGADTTMKTMAGLLAKAKALYEEGLTAYIWTGGYSTQPTSIMKTFEDDIMFIKEVIGTGELAISDERSDEPDVKELARIISQTHLAGNLAQKSGLTHFHVGEGKDRINLLFEILESRKEIKAEWLYPTHINRSKTLIKDAVKLAKAGAYVDIDTVDEDLAKWLPIYIEAHGPLDKLTLSSDAAMTSPSNLYNQFRGLLKNKRYGLERLLPLVTRNAAKALKLKETGEIKDLYKANLVVLDPKSYEIIHVISRGEFHIRDGSLVKREKYLKDSNRVVDLKGQKDQSSDSK